MARFRLNQPHTVEYWPARIVARLDADAEINTDELVPWFKPSPMMTPLDSEAEIMWRAEIDRIRAANWRQGSVPVVGSLHHLPGGDAYAAIERRRRETGG
jgi:hypothetical protein